MKKTTVIIILIFLFPRVFGQIGFLGKRNVISTDLFNTIYQGKYNLNYNFCLGKSFMLKTSYALHRHSNTILLTDANNYYTSNENDVADISLKGHSWELGFDYGYFLLTNMPMPIGYYWGMAFEHFSGTVNESCTDNNYFPSIEKKYFFNNKANIFKLIYGRNSYIKYNFILKASIEIGFYSGSTIENDSSNTHGCPPMVLPLSNPIIKNIKYEGAYDKMKKVTFYIMPNISIGYIF